MNDYNTELNLSTVYNTVLKTVANLQLYITPLLPSLLSRLYLSPIVQLGCQLYISDSYFLSSQAPDEVSLFFIKKKNY